MVKEKKTEVEVIDSGLGEPPVKEVKPKVETTKERAIRLGIIPAPKEKK